MRRKSLAFATVVLLSLASVQSTAQTILDYFSEDCFLVVRIDLGPVFEVIPEAELNTFRVLSMEAFGFDVLERTDAMSIGFDLPALMEEDIAERCIVIEGRVSIEEILESAERHNEKLNSIQVGGLQAYEANIDKGIQFYFSNISPGLWLHASRRGVELFNAVRSGGKGSTADNELLRLAWADTREDAFLRVAGYFDERLKQQMAAQMPALGDLDTMAISANHDGDGFNFAVVLGSGNPESLNVIKVMAEQSLPVAAAQDTTGLLQEIIDSLQYSLAGNRLVITGFVSAATIEKSIPLFTN